MLRALLVSISLAAAACATQPGSPAASACADVGTTLCRGLYTCLTAMEIAADQLPPTEDECVTEENAHCDDAMPSPGYCKGRPEVSAEAATACADALAALTCQQVQEPAPDACASQMCAPQ